MSDIKEAKKELFKNLEKYDEVVGVVIKREQKEDAQPYLVVYLSKITKAILKLIPKEFRGNKVVSEIKGIIKPF